MTRVAIAMAVYEPNAEFLRIQLDSIRAQEGVDWTAHVVDDGSSEEGWTRLLDAVDDDSRFVLHRSPANRGSVAAFGVALGLAAADEPDAIALSDQDDRWHPDRLAASAELLGPEVALVHSDLRMVDGSGTVVAESVWAREHRRPVSGLRGSILRNVVTGCTVTMRPDVADLALPIPDHGRDVPYHHDAWLALQALRLGAVVGIDRPLVDYRHHGANVVGVSRTGIVDVVRHRRHSMAESFRRAAWSRRVLAQDLMASVAEHPVDPAEPARVAREVGVFLGEGGTSDHADLWRAARGSSDMSRRLGQWYLGRALEAISR